MKDNKYLSCATKMGWATCSVEMDESSKSSRCHRAARVWWPGVILKSIFVIALNNSNNSNNLDSNSQLIDDNADS